MVLKPIDTVYKGFKFRSRLEARWAVFFETIGLKWEYEKEGYDLDGLFYLPDFYLPELDCFIEIKGRDANGEELEKAERLARLSEKKVFVFDKGMPINELDLGHDFSAVFIPFLENGKVTISYDYNYLFCVCNHCGEVGIEYDGRGDRVCIECPSICQDRDKGYSSNNPKIVNGFKVAKMKRFEFKDGKTK